mgnify:CR=1 FL=1
MSSEARLQRLGLSHLRDKPKELQKELSTRKFELLTTMPWRQEAYAALETEDYSMNPSEPEFEPQRLTGSVL